MKKNCVFVAAGLGLVQLALLSTAARAQDTSRTLNAVTVTATRFPEKLKDIGRVVTVITAEDINRAQGETLPQLLNNVAGITFSGANNAPGISSALYLRGASTGNTLILINGFPVNNASAIDGSYDLNAIPLDQIERIEILKGSGSTLYGSDAVAGVINIITKQFFETGYNNELQVSAGSYNTFKESYGLNREIAHGTNLVLNLSNTDSRGFPAATDTTGKAGYKNDGFHQRSGSLQLTQTVVPGKFYLYGNLQTSYNSGNLPFGAYQDDKNYTYDNTFLFGGIGGKLILPKGNLVFNISQNNVWNNYTDVPTPLNDSTHQVVKNKGRITNVEVVLNSYLGKNFDLTSGAGFKYSSTDQYSLYNTMGFNPPASVIGSDSAHSSITSVFSSLFYKSGIFHMELGGRYNHDSKYGDNFTYTVNPSVMLFKRLKLFATIASAYKSPTLYQLYSQYGNIDLKPETTSSYEAGFDLQVIQNILSFNSVFYKYNTKDVIYFFTDPNTFNSAYKNGEHQDDKGFESELKLKVDALTASAYWAFVTGALTDENGVTTGNLFRRPKDTYGVTVFYQFTKTFSAGLVDRYTGNRTDENFNTFPATIITLKPYNLVDVHLQYAISKKVSVFADLRNLFDVKYTDWLGYNTNGFNFMSGLKWQF